jgi:hypothetical protein
MWGAAQLDQKVFVSTKYGLTRCGGYEIRRMGWSSMWRNKSEISGSEMKGRTRGKRDCPPNAAARKDPAN